MNGLMLAITVLLGWIATVCLHEFGHALVAYYGGDTSVKDKGYLTLNPLKYTDIGYSLVMPVVFLVIGGIALPGAAVYIDTSLLRGRAWKSAVSAAGPLATALVALILSIPFQLGWATADSWVWQALALLTLFQVAGFFFNLLPMPSFDGFGIIEPWLPLGAQRTAQRWGRYGYLVLLALFWTVPVFSRSFWALVSSVTQQLQVPPVMVRTAYLQFAESSKVIFIVLLFVVLIGRRLLSIRKKKRHECPLDTPNVLVSDLTDEYRSSQCGALQSDDDTWFQRGQMLSSLGDFEAAITSYSKALKQDRRAEVWYGRAIARHRIGDYEEALADYRQTLVVNPDHRYAWVNVGRVLEHLQDFKAALQAYDQSLQVVPNNAQCWQARGRLLLSLGQSAEALYSFDNSLKYERLDPSLWIQQAQLLQTFDKPRQAARSYEKAAGLEPENIAVWRSLGNLALQLSRPQQAVRYYDKALFYSSQDSTTLLLRGLTLYHVRQLPLANQDFESLYTLLREESSQPVQPSEILLNLPSTLKPVVERFSDFLEQHPGSGATVIAQVLLLVALDQPQAALKRYNCYAQANLNELRDLEEWFMQLRQR